VSQGLVGIGGFRVANTAQLCDRAGKATAFSSAKTFTCTLELASLKEQHGCQTITASPHRVNSRLQTKLEASAGSPQSAVPRVRGKRGSLLRETECPSRSPTAKAIAAANLFDP